MSPFTYGDAARSSVDLARSLGEVLDPRLAALANERGIAYDDPRGNRSSSRGVQVGMAVRLLLSSGGERIVDAADSARLDGPFFLVRRSYPDLNRTETVLTLLSRDVIAAEVLKDGVRIDYIAGRGPTQVGKDPSAMDAPPRFVPDRERSPGTLGAVLYASPSKAFVSEAEWVALVRSVAEGDQSALHALYERAHRAVFTFVMRITANGESAEEVTLDVFHGVWQHASRYQEADGTVLGWIMNQAHSRAIDRRRFDHRQKRVQSEAGDPFPATGTAHPDDLIAFKQQSQALGNALVVLTPDERNAIEATFFSELTYAEVAARLNEPLGTIKIRVHSGLHKLRGALAEGGPRA